MRIVLIVALLVTVAAAEAAQPQAGAREHTIFVYGVAKNSFRGAVVGQSGKNLPLKSQHNSTIRLEESIDSFVFVVCAVL